MKAAVFSLLLIFAVSVFGITEPAEKSGYCRHGHCYRGRRRLSVSPQQVQSPSNMVSNAVVFVNAPKKAENGAGCNLPPPFKCF